MSGGALAEVPEVPLRPAKRESSSYQVEGETSPMLVKKIRLVEA